MCLGSFVAHAQQNQIQRPSGYPAKPIRVLVGSSPGGGVDIITRSAAQKLTERWGRPVVVDNRTGAGGVIAVELLARAAPDGHTLYGGGSQVVTATPLKKVPFDTRKVLDPVVQMTSSWYLLVVPPALPVTSVKDLISYARSRPTSYGSAGMGSGTHLGTELFKHMAGRIDMVHIPYKGNGQALNDLMAGEIQMLFTSTISGAPHMKNGRLKSIAVTSLQRLAVFPEVPTISESGVPNFEMDNFYGIYAPHGIPSAILLALNKEIAAIMNSPEMNQAVAADGAQVAPPAPAAEFKAKFARQIDMWENFIKSTNIKVQ
jgi:tripartite-type tricarboxylate transporter receptor subunit TctC